MNQVIKLITKEYRLFWSDRVAVSLTFIVPVVLTVIFGAVFGGMSRGPSGIRLAFVNESASEIAKKIESELDTTKAVRLLKTFTDDSKKEIKFDSVSAKEYVIKGSASAALILPADMFTDTSAGIKVKLYYDPKNDIEMQMLQGIVQKTIFEKIPGIFNQTMLRRSEQWLGADSGKAFNSEMANIISKYFEVDTSWFLNPSSMSQQYLASDTSTGAGNFFKSMIQIEQTQLVGQQVVSPWATRSVGGWAMMFLLFT
ncbi:MAG: ABC transporter permease, partial [Bacteroidetes bacterium]